MVEQQITLYGKNYNYMPRHTDGTSCPHCDLNENSKLCHEVLDCGDGYYATAPGQALKFKSDGGSSDYYKLKIKRASDGQEFECEMGDVIYSVFGGDFDLGNIVKACRRMYLDTQGTGKDGIDAEYDGKKIEWFTKDFLQRVKSKGE